MPEGSARPPQTARQRAVLALVREQGFVSVADIASRFGVSEMTARRDLQALERVAELRRTYGGAVTPEGSSREPEPPFVIRQRVNAEAKRRIGRAAAALVRPAEIIGIDVGTTTLELARCLAGRQALRVCTNSLRAAQLLAQAGVRVYVPGGEVRPMEMSVTGGVALQQLQQYRLDRVFIGISGLTGDGLYDYSPEDSEVKRMLIQQAAEVVVLADAEKLGRVSGVRIAPLDAAHLLITDQEPVGLASELTTAGVRVVVA